MFRRSRKGLPQARFRPASGPGGPGQPIGAAAAPRTVGPVAQMVEQLTFNQ